MASQQSERPWRARVAMENFVSRLKNSYPLHHEVSKEYRDLPQDHWESLGNFISALESSDVVFKAEALDQLSLFLLCVASTSASTSASCFMCPDAFRIFTQFGSKGLVLRLEDIQLLHNLLFAELAYYTAWLFGRNVDTCDSNSTVNSINILSVSDGCAHWAICVKTLQCCIRILPLLEFHTGLSFCAAKTLMSIFKQLCCPVNICQLIDGGLNYLGCQRDGRVKCVDGLHGPKFHDDFAHEDDWLSASATWICSLEVCIKHLKEYSRKISTVCFPCKDVMGFDIHNTSGVMDPAQIACTLLEVFVDELLSQPGLAGVLASPDMRSNLDLSFIGDSSYEKDVVLSIEAAVAHFIISFSRCHCMGLSPCIPKMMNLGNFGVGLSLPAAVVLFDLSIADAFQVSYPFLVHVVNLLARSLEIDSCLVVRPNEDMVLTLAVAVLESAIKLYCRLWRPSSLKFSYEPDFNLLVTPLRNLLTSKVGKFCDGHNKNVSLAFEGLLNGEKCSHAEQVSMQESLSTHTGEWFLCMANATQLKDWKNQGSDEALELPCSGNLSKDVGNICGTKLQEHSIPPQRNCCSAVECTSLVPNVDLLVSVLQLIHASLHRIVIEASKHDAGLLPVSPAENGSPLAPDGGFGCVSGALYIDVVEKAFEICVSREQEKTLNMLRIDKHFGRLFDRAGEVMDLAFAFFVERLSFELEQGASKVLRVAYWDVLKSLTNLLIFRAHRREESNLKQHVLVCEDMQTDSPHENNNQMNGEQAMDKSGLTGTTQDLEIVRSSALAISKIFKEKYDRILRQQKEQPRLGDTINLAGRNKARPHKSLQKQNFRSREELMNNASTSEGRNVYIEEILRQDGNSGDSFEDLKDFIVCKKGRDYCTWMKIQRRRRRRKLHRSYWRRLREKRALKALLSCIA